MERCQIVARNYGLSYRYIDFKIITQLSKGQTWKSRKLLLISPSAEAFDSCPQSPYPTSARLLARKTVRSNAEHYKREKIKPLQCNDLQECRLPNGP